MTEHRSPTGEESERISVVRDPPLPPGYVDPLESSPLLDGATSSGPPLNDGVPVDAETPIPP